LLSSGCEYQQKFPSSILPSSVNFGQTQMLCLLYFILGTKSQSDNNSPQLGQTGYISSLGDLSFCAAIVRLECSTQTCTRSPMKTHFPSLFVILKSKGKRTPSHPTVSIVRTRRVSRDTFEREKDNGFETCAKFYIQLWNWMIFLQTISIIRKCYPSLFAHFHNTLLHIILIFPRL
jgi:hypothetical protein